MDTHAMGLYSDPSVSSVWHAVTLDHLDIKFLYQWIRSGYDLTQRNPDDYGLLYLAVKNENMEAMRMLLLQPSIHINQPHGRYNELALHCAANAGFTEGIELLIEHNSFIDYKDTLGHTPLTNCLFAKSLTGFRLLIQAGASLLHKDEHGNTLAHLAVAQCPEALETILSHVHVDELNHRGLSAIALAVSLGQTSSVLQLLEAGANINQQVRFNTLLHHAVLWNRLPVICMLVERACQLNTLNAMEETPLLAAVQQNKLDIVRYLVSQGADPLYATPGTNLPLLYAARHGYTEMCVVLMTDTTPLSFLKLAVEMSSDHPSTMHYLTHKSNKHS
ncbi:ankyrin repeat-containing domain protein [Spinellus fusiger]|nr:ankyrin repeat-containing domain protein [Spinellus fusiger]